MNIIDKFEDFKQSTSMHLKNVSLQYATAPYESTVKKSVPCDKILQMVDRSRKEAPQEVSKIQEHCCLNGNLIERFGT